MIICVFCYNCSMQKKVHFTENTSYGLIEVADWMYQGDLVRFLSVDGNAESAMFLDEDRKNDLVFHYMQRFSYAFFVNPDIRSTLLIGGGAFSYPKYYLDHYRHNTITVVELSQKMIDLAYRYFRMDELDIEQQSNLKIICDDAFTWLKQSDETYDWIINDAFIADLMQGREESFLPVIRQHLNPDGMYMENHISTLTGIHSHSLYRREKQLQKYFSDVTKIICNDEMEADQRQNVILCGINREVSDGQDR